MKRKLHFRYYWEDCNQNVIRVNLRDGTEMGVRFHYGGDVKKSMWSSGEWSGMIEGQAAAFPITRAQAREFLKTGVAPKFSLLNRW
jgi:hypothetical protein